MRLKEFDIMLDIKSKENIEEYVVVQGDINSNIFNIILTEGDEEYDLTDLIVEIAFAKADGKTVLQDTNNGVNIVNNKIICTLNSNTISYPGKVSAEVRVLEFNKILTSTRFNFYVRKSLVSDETIISTNEFPILTQKINEVNQLIEDMAGMEAVKGDSAYQVWINEGNEGTIQDYLNSLMGPEGKSLEFNWDGKNLGIRVEGQTEYQYVNLQGDIGNGLEYNWNGTQLGVRVAGTIEYSYADLRGPTGTIDNLDKTNVTDALGYVPIKSINQEVPDVGGNLDLNIPPNIEIIDNLTEVIGGKALDATQGKILDDKVNNLEQEQLLSINNLKYSELSSIATNADSEGIYANIEWKRKDNSLYAKSTLIGVSPIYNQVKVDYYDDLGTTIIKTITWDITYDDNDFPYLRTVI